MKPDEENVSSTPKPETSEQQTPASPTNGFVPGPGRRRGALLFAAIALVLVAAVIYSGIHSRATAESRLKQRTDKAAIPIVDVVSRRKARRSLKLCSQGLRRP